MKSADNFRKTIFRRNIEDCTGKMGLKVDGEGFKAEKADEKGKKKYQN